MTSGPGFGNFRGTIETLKPIYSVHIPRFMKDGMAIERFFFLFLFGTCSSLKLKSALHTKACVHVCNCLFVYFHAVLRIATRVISNSDVLRRKNPTGISNYPV